MSNLTGRTAIVTGASSGIGRAVASALGAAGAHVYLAGRTVAALEHAAGLITAAGGTATFEAFEIRERGAINRLVDRAVHETGRLNIMVNSAGLERLDTIIDGDIEHWQEMVDVNIIALLAGSRAAIKAMRAGGFEGHIVNISSIAARTDASGVYGATKAAVNAIGTTLRRELEDDPIRVVTIMPGATITNFGRHFPADFVNGVLRSLGSDHTFTQGDRLPDALIDHAATLAAGTLASAEDVARSVLFAVSQPIGLNIAELVVRPAKGFALPTRNDG